MSPPQEVLFIVNPKAGLPGKTSFKESITRHLDIQKFRFRLEYTRYAGHAGELSAEAAQNNASIVVAVGGDGTMNECAGSLIGSDTSLGIIPSGSGNGLARDLGIPTNPAKAIQLLNQGHIHYIDAGMINQWKFFCTAGIGFDAHVSKKFGLLKTRGFIGYIKTALNAYFQFQSSSYRIWLENRQLEQNAFSITLANACQFGNNAYIAPEAKPGDGYLNLCVVDDFPKYMGAWMVYRLFSGTINQSRYMKDYPIKKATIECPVGSVIHLDGEIRKTDDNKLVVQVIPAALKVIVPQR